MLYINFSPTPVRELIHTQDNLLIASKLVVDDITVVEQSIEHLKHLKHLKNDLIRNFAHAHACGYYELQGSTNVKMESSLPLQTC